MKTPDVFTLKGLRAAPAQVTGAFRLVPLIRENLCSDIRLGLEKYDREFARVSLDDRTEYWSFIPHGFVLDWGKGPSSITVGGQIRKQRTTKQQGWFAIRNEHRMVKRRSSTAVRILPLHLSMEYFLGLAFAGPKINWPEFSKFVRDYGLGFRSEMFTRGHWLYRFDEAIRTFEINEGQVGMLVYAADELASLFVVPTPEDYRLVHKTLLEDFFGNLIYDYAVYYQSSKIDSTFNFDRVTDVRGLRRTLHFARDEWAKFSTDVMASNLVDRSIQKDVIYKPGNLQLERFMTELVLNGVNSIGERIVRADGELLYAKTYRLDADQTKRAWLLSGLERNDWNLHATADSLQMEVKELVRSLERAGFGYILNPDLLRRSLKP